MAKRKRFRPTADRKPSTMATTTSSPFHQQRTRKGAGARGGVGETGAAKNTNGIHKPRKMKTFARISSSSPSPFSGPWPSAQSNNNKHNNGNGKRTRLNDVSPTTASPTRATSTHTHKQMNNRNHSKNGQHNRPIIPFGKRDRILLVGEGDFSFARSIVLHHHCKSVLATCYDSREELYEKYPHVKKNLDDFLLPKLSHKQEGEKEDKEREEQKEEEEEAGNREDVDHNEGRQILPSCVNNSSYYTAPNVDAATAPPTTTDTAPAVLFSIDVRKLGSTKAIRRGFPSRKKKPAWKHARPPRTHGQGQSVDFLNGDKRSCGGPWDVICFNFPHVGGLSTDVNRQVRANQELLVAFFRASRPLLSALDDGEEEDSDISEDEDDVDLELKSDLDGNSNNEIEQGGLAGVPRKKLTRGGQILVTLFEGEPYTLWNIKDLARHAGLSVVTSFKFPWGAYPGYSHARTIGAIAGRNGEPGGWHGEDRLARTFVFEVPDDNKPTQTQKTRKRVRSDSDSDG